MNITPAIAAVRRTTDQGPWTLQSKPNTNDTAIEVLCTKQNALKEITDELHKAYRVLKYRPVLDDLSEHLSNPRARPPESIAAPGNDEIN
jgi:hypothetical protein